jgi:hypothetical protein
MWATMTSKRYQDPIDVSEGFLIGLKFFCKESGAQTFERRKLGNARENESVQKKGAGTTLLK